MTSAPYVYGAPESLGPIFAKMGGRYTIGALRMCDSPAGQLVYRFPANGDRASLTVRGSELSRAEGGVIYFDVGFEFPVSGRSNTCWRMFVASEPNSTFSLWLVEYVDGYPHVIGSRRDVANDNTLCNAIIDLHKSVPRSGLASLAH